MGNCGLVPETDLTVLILQLKNLPGIKMNLAI